MERCRMSHDANHLHGSAAGTMAVDAAEIRTAKLHLVVGSRGGGAPYVTWMSEIAVPTAITAITAITALTARRAKVPEGLG